MVPMLRLATSGLKVAAGSHALLDRHGRRAAGGDVDHAVGALLDDLEERRERLRRLVGPAVLGVARVQVHHRRAGLRRADGGVRDLLAVIGRCGDIDGVWIEPVTAQVMMTLRALAMVRFLDARFLPLSYRGPAPVSSRMAAAHPNMAAQQKSCLCRDGT